MLFLSDVRRVCVVLCVLALVVFVPSLAFGTDSATAPDVAYLVQLAKDHSWPLLAAIVVGFLVRLVKEERVPINVAPRFRPLLAVALGMVSAICEAVILKTPILTAAIGGFGSAVIAIGGHDVLVEAIFGGKEPSVKASGGVVGLVIMALVAMSQSGCAAKRDLEKALDTSVVIIDRAEPCFVGMQQAELRQCEPDNAECIQRVKDRWSPVADALDAYRAFLCGISPDAEGC
jgi:hypothetical protein